MAGQVKDTSAQHNNRSLDLINHYKFIRGHQKLPSCLLAPITPLLNDETSGRDPSFNLSSNEMFYDI